MFTWWFMPPPLSSELPGSAAAQTLEIREIQPLRLPGLESSFRFGFERQTLRLGSKLPGGWQWPKDTRPAAAAGRKRGPLRLQPNPASHPTAASAGGGSSSRATLPPGSWGAPIVLRGAKQWPPTIRSLCQEACRWAPLSALCSCSGGPRPSDILTALTA